MGREIILRGIILTSVKAPLGIMQYVPSWGTFHSIERTAPDISPYKWEVKDGGSSCVLLHL